MRSGAHAAHLSREATLLGYRFKKIYRRLPQPTGAFCLWRPGTTPPFKKIAMTQSDQSANPNTGELPKCFKQLTSAQLENSLATAESGFQSWKQK